MSADDPAEEPSLSGLLPREDLDRLSLLQLLDLIAQRLPKRHGVLIDLVYLRERIEATEELNEQARAALEKFDQVVEKLRAPALRVGTWLGLQDLDKAMVCVNGTDYVCSVDPDLDAASLQLGERVLCNEAYAVVRSLGFETQGQVVRVEELLSDGRLRIGQEGAGTSSVILRSDLTAKEKLKPGVEIRLDANQRVALEVIGHGKRIERSLQRVDELPWDSIGGQADAVEAIRDTLEMPFLHADLYRRFEHTLPKGFLLHGPPGCGKTLLGRATAYNLRRQIREQSGVDRPEFFLHVKGPEVLNMWVGESERQVRDLFTQCRERAKDGALAFLFIDEAESILGTRRSGRHAGMLSTIVPMFCTEMDGLEPLENTVVILASNRADLIDPAILRPGRIDRKIRVRRPDEAGARAIYEIYLKETLPLAEPRELLVEFVTRRHFARVAENEFLEVSYRSGRRETLYRGDLASGAIIAAVVERAKGLAIRRAVKDGQDPGIGRGDLENALRLEHLENDLFPGSDLTEDWLKLTDFDPENVVRLGPVRKRNDTERRGTV
jgi:proteasome-associated ATPase